MAPELEEALAAELAAWEARGLLRRPEPLAAPCHSGDFVSNDYLSLSQHDELRRAAAAAVERHGVGARGSRSLGGGCPLDEAAETACAQWLGAEAALLFSSGYQANLGLVSALASRGDAVFSDGLNHASLVDAARLSRAEVFVHRHLDLEQLETQLAQARGARRRIVLTEAVFSMDGDASALDELDEICTQHDAWLVVDEAHSIGLLGPEGAGAWAELLARGLAGRSLAARVVTGGKALGVGGALVVGSRLLCEQLRQRSRTFVYTTGVSPAVSGSLVAAIDVCRRLDDRRAAALGNARALATALRLPEPAAAIVPFHCGANEAAVHLAKELARDGFEVRAVRPPTVPEGTSRLRLCTHAHNDRATLERLAARLDQAALTMRDRRDGHEVLRKQTNYRLSPTLVVTGTDTDVGKTIVSALLVLAAARLGPSIYWKPVQTGADSDTDRVRDLARAANCDASEPAYCFPLPASPHAAAADVGQSISAYHLDSALRRERTRRPEARLIMECAGGLYVPFNSELTQLEWIAAHRLPIVLVARSGLGTLNHTMLSLEALRSRRLRAEALFLVGNRHPSNRATLEQMSGLRRIYEVPLFQPLDREALERWLDAADLAPLFAAMYAAQLP